MRSDTRDSCFPSAAGSVPVKSIVLELKPLVQRGKCKMIVRTKRMAQCVASERMLKSTPDSLSSL